MKVLILCVDSSGLVEFGIEGALVAERSTMPDLPVPYVHEGGCVLEIIEGD